MKRVLTILCCGAMLFSLAACGGSGTPESSASAVEAAEAASGEESSTITGQVQALDGDTATLLLGELSESAPGGMGGGGQPEGMEPLEGEAPDGIERPPEGDQPEGMEQPKGGQPDGMERPEGEAPSDMGGGFGGYSFTAGEEQVILNLSSAEITLSDGGTGSVSDLAVGDVVTVSLDEAGTASSVAVLTLGGMSAPGGAGGFGGGSTEVEQGAAANEITEDGSVTGTAYESTGDDENALRVTGAAVTLDGITVDKSGGASSNAETGDFYGMNAALLATDGAEVTITNADITSSAQNGNGVFSYGEGTTVNISDSTITTTADNSGGIQTTGGGATYASNLTVETSGSSSAAIRSDRGGGTVVVDGGAYTSNGYNSPAVYSTADITVSNAVLTANNSEALVIEGQNSITLADCQVSGNMSDTQGSSSDINVHNVMIYQSMSGDAESGTSVFTMTGGSLTGNNGDMFYVTNTDCILTLSGVELVSLDAGGNLLTVSGNDASHGWGTAGANGGQVAFTADGQELNGNIVVDSISQLTLVLGGGSTLTGTISIVDNAEGGAAVEDNAVVTIDAGSTWNLTGDCTITSLTNNGTINFNGYTITLADGTVLSE